MENLLLLDSAEKELLLKILETYNSSTDLKAFIVDLEGNPIIMNKNPLESCRFCRIIRENEKARERCSEAYSRAGKLAATLGEPYIFRCPAGLIEWATPILYKGQHFGSIICGQVLMWEPEDYFWIELTRMNKHYNFDMGQLIAAAQELPVISGKKVQAAADLLFMIANHILKSSIVSMEQRKKLKQQNILLLEEMEKRKTQEYPLNRYNSYITNEKELLSKIKLEDTEQAQDLVKDILEQLQKQYSNNIESLKTRISELIILISRVIIEKGGEPEKVLNLNSYYINELSYLQSPESILSCIPAIVNEYINLIKNLPSKRSQIVKEASEYIHNNFHLNLKLENIADAVFISPHYLSHIFKQDTGYTIFEYITNIRIEEAKKLLNRQINIDEVAQNVGFKNSSYFSKIFKNIEGVTPSQYRKKI